jgi:hypothetical protein
LVLSGLANATARTQAVSFFRVLISDIHRVYPMDSDTIQHLPHYHDMQKIQVDLDICVLGVYIVAMSPFITTSIAHYLITHHHLLEGIT